MARRRVYGGMLPVILCLVLLSPRLDAAGPEGELTYAMHVTLAPVWFDPAENTGLITPMMAQYGLHDALFKPMPEGRMTPSLAESYTESSDKLTCEFTLRPHLTFHNGDPLTTEDVKFTFERYKGAAAKLLKEKVKAIEIVDARRIRFQLTEPWLDFILPEIDALYQQQAVESDAARRAKLLHKIQQIAYDAVHFIPLYAWVWHSGVGPRVADASLGKIPLFYYTGPFEDMQLKGQ